MPESDKTVRNTVVVYENKEDNVSPITVEMFIMLHASQIIIDATNRTF